MLGGESFSYEAKVSLSLPGESAILVLFHQGARPPGF